MSELTFESKPEHNLGKQTLTFRMAANAIFNKLNIALVTVKDQSSEAILEARELAESIVQHSRSGDGDTRDRPEPNWPVEIQKIADSLEPVTRLHGDCACVICLARTSLLALIERNK